MKKISEILGKNSNSAGRWCYWCLRFSLSWKSTDYSALFYFLAHLPDKTDEEWTDWTTNRKHIISTSCKVINSECVTRLSHLKVSMFREMMQSQVFSIKTLENQHLHRLVILESIWETKKLHKNEFCTSSLRPMKKKARNLMIKRKNK